MRRNTVRAWSASVSLLPGASATQSIPAGAHCVRLYWRLRGTSVNVAPRQTGNQMASEMNTGRPGSDSGNTAEGGKNSPATQPPGTKQTLRDLGRLIVELWWRFFEWLAVVPWKTLLIVFFLGLIVAGILNRPIPFVLFIVVSAIIKVVAGGKRRAELSASQASQRAETEQL